MVLVTCTVHSDIEELPSKPGVNCSSTEKAAMLESARLRGAAGSTGSTPDWMVAPRACPDPTLVTAHSQNW